MLPQPGFGLFSKLNRKAHRASDRFVNNSPKELALRHFDAIPLLNHCSNLLFIKTQKRLVAFLDELFYFHFCHLRVMRSYLLAPILASIWRPIRELMGTS